MAAVSSSILMLLAALMAASAAAVPQGLVQDCSVLEKDLADCYDYVHSGGTAAPTSQCCNAAGNVFIVNPHCFCPELIKYSVFVNITLAIHLASDCSITPPAPLYCATPSTPPPPQLSPPTPALPSPSPVLPSPVLPSPSPVLPSPTPVLPTPTPVLPSPGLPSPTPVLPTPPSPVLPSPSSPEIPSPAGQPAKSDGSRLATSALMIVPSLVFIVFSILMT